MLVIPAIDLMGGKAVRLKAGKREDVTVYSDAPWELAAQFAEAGATCLHVVDLDGAFEGGARQSALIQRIAAAFRAGGGRDVQVGGGLRTEEAVREVLDAGATYAVLGTIAAKSPKLVLKLCEALPGKVIVAADAHGNEVRVEGWAKGANVDLVELVLRAAIWGAARLLYTDVSRDGLQVGPNVEATARLQRLVGPDTPVIASGGISSLDDLKRLSRANVQQCVVGRAIYEKNFSVREAMNVTRGRAATPRPC